MYTSCAYEYMHSEKKKNMLSLNIKKENRELAFLSVSIIKFADILDHFISPRCLRGRLGLAPSAFEEMKECSGVGLQSCFQKIDDALLTAMYSPKFS